MYDVKLNFTEKIDITQEAIESIFDNGEDYLLDYAVREIQK